MQGGRLLRGTEAWSRLPTVRRAAMVLQRSSQENPAEHVPSFRGNQPGLFVLYFSGISFEVETLSIQETNFSTHQWRFCRLT